MKSVGDAGLQPYAKFSLALVCLLSAISLTLPAQAQLTKPQTIPTSRGQNWWCSSDRPCPHLLEIAIVQGQGQVCWSAQNYAGLYTQQPPTQVCTTSNAVALFYDGDLVTFTATGSNGYSFSHWITPDKDNYSANPINLSIPIPILGNPMEAVFTN